MPIFYQNIAPRRNRRDTAGLDMGRITALPSQAISVAPSPSKSKAGSVSARGPVPESSDERPSSPSLHFQRLSPMRQFWAFPPGFGLHV